MKIFKHRNIMGLIYGLILAIPMLSILVRSAYVVVNKNAKDSYGAKMIDTAIQLNSSNVNSLYVNGQYITYTFGEHNTQWNASFGFSEISIDLNELFNTSATWNKFYLYKDSQDILFYTTTNQTYRLNATDRQFESFTYQVDLTPSADKAIYDYGVAFIYTFTTDTLDNAFDYSLSEYVSENSFGNLNFFEWWSNLFLDLNNPKSALYIHFVNWYMNYVLFVSSSYILFMVLMWFINYSRRLMERGLNYDW